jgi:hypothetical protein
VLAVQAEAADPKIRVRKKITSDMERFCMPELSAKRKIVHLRVSSAARSRDRAFSGGFGVSLGFDENRVEGSLAAHPLSHHRTCSSHPAVPGVTSGKSSTSADRSTLVVQTTQGQGPGGIGDCGRDATSLCPIRPASMPRESSLQAR